MATLNRSVDRFCIKLYKSEKDTENQTGFFDASLPENTISGKLDKPFYISEHFLKELLVGQNDKDICDLYAHISESYKGGILASSLFSNLDASWNYDLNSDLITSLNNETYLVNIFNLTNNNKRQTLIHLTNQICDWVYLNQLRLRTVPDFPNIFNFTGRNKLGGKELAQSLGITVPKTYQVVDEIREIKWESLPKTYVIKPSNLDGAKKVYVIKDGVNLVTGKKMNVREMTRDYRHFRTKQMDKELNKYLKEVLVPKIIVEEYIDDGGSFVPIDYKCYVFRGSLAFVLAIDGGSDRKRFAFYDRVWTRIPNETFSTNTEPISRPIPKPKTLEKLIRNAETLGQAFQQAMKGCWEGDCLRIDFYINDKDVYFGEFAIFPNGGKGKNVNTKGLSLIHI